MFVISESFSLKLKLLTFCKNYWPPNWLVKFYYFNSFFYIVSYNFHFPKVSYIILKVIKEMKIKTRNLSILLNVSDFCGPLYIYIYMCVCVCVCVCVWFTISMNKSGWSLGYTVYICLDNIYIYIYIYIYIPRKFPERQISNISHFSLCPYEDRSCKVWELH